MNKTSKPATTKKNAPAKKAPAKPRGRPKAVAPAASTGNLGGTFENRVQAVRLLHMCTGMTSQGIPQGFKIVEMRLQGRVHGHHTDDLVCTIEDSQGMRRKVLYQVKSGLTSQKSDSAFEESIGGAWLDYSSGTFVKKTDSIVIAYDAASRESMKGASAISNLAFTSINAIDWEEKITTKGSGNALKRNALGAIKSIVNLYAQREASIVEVHEFMRHLSFIEQDLEDAKNSSIYSDSLRLIESSCRFSLTEGNAAGIWSSLVEICQGLNGVAGGISIETLGDFLDPGVSRVFKFFRDGQLPSRLSTAASGRSPDDLSSGTLVISKYGYSEIEGLDSDRYIPSGRSTSLNKLASIILESISSEIKRGKFEDAVKSLSAAASDMSAFDAHQRARWYLMRGVCRWNSDRIEEAAEDFIKSFEICADDEKFSAANIRGLLMKGDVEGAKKAGVSAAERFPESLHVWLINKNVAISQGEALIESQIPNEFKDEADAYQLVALSLHQKGLIQDAAEVARKAIQMPTASFNTRDAALSFTLESLSPDGLHLVFDVIPQGVAAELEIVANSFEPRYEKLWSVQSKPTLRRTVSNLGNTLLLMKRADSAAELIKEARQHGLTGDELLRIEIDALRLEEKYDEAISNLGLLESKTHPDVLVGLAQVAVLANKPEPIIEIIKIANKAESTDERLLGILRALLWGALARSSRLPELRDEISTFEMNSENSVALVAQACRVYFTLGLNTQGEACIERLLSLLEKSESRDEQCMGALTLFQRQRYEECVPLYERILPKGVVSELHNELLVSYIRSGAHAAAREFVSSFPDNWMETEETRHIAIELAHQVGDWTLFEALAEFEKKANPHIARSWIMNLMVASRKDAAAIKSVLEQIPSELDGEAREITQISVCEISNGYQDIGLDRVYKLRRKNMADVDTAAAHISAHLLAKTSLQKLDREFKLIEAGVAFEFIDETGTNYIRTIDPIEFTGLPGDAEFKNSSDREIQPFLGKGIGDEVIFNQGFGDSKVFRVTGITSAYRRLIDNSRDTIENSVSKSTLLTIIKIGEDSSGNLDFSNVTSKIQHQEESGKNAMSAYAGKPMTLGMLSRMLGRDLTDVIWGWSQQDVPLQVARGGPEERTLAFDIIEDNKNSFVIDASALLELAQLDCLHLLAHLPKIYCSTKTYDLIRGQLRKSEEVLPSGSAATHQGELVFRETPEHEWSHRINLLRLIKNAIEVHCKVLPSYGALDSKRFPNNVRKVFSEEETAALQLCQETDSVLISLDGRLRDFGALIKINGIWPQVLLGHVNELGQLSNRDYAIAILKQMINRRDFVWLDDESLLMGIYQGKGWVGVLFGALNLHISDGKISYVSAEILLLDFLRRMGSTGTCQMGFYIEMVGLVAEALGRHKDAPLDISNHLKNEIIYGLKLTHGMFNSTKRSIDAGLRRATKSVRFSKIKGDVLRCSSPPRLVNGLADDENFEEGKMQDGVSSAEMPGVQKQTSATEATPEKDD